MFGKCRLLFAGIAVLSPLASLAHHAFALDFDKDLEGQVSGVVTRVSFRNPHVRYFVEVVGANGESKSWELQPPGNVAIFRRENWHANTIQEGDHLVATGNTHGKPDQILVSSQPIEAASRSGSQQERDGYSSQVCCFASSAGAGEKLKRRPIRVENSPCVFPLERMRDIAPKTLIRHSQPG